jgi:hypothetical protein
MIYVKAVLIYFILLDVGTALQSFESMKKLVCVCVSTATDVRKSLVQQLMWEHR